MEITLIVHEEDGSFWSEVSELPGCFATGATLSELHEAVADVVGLYLWDLPARLSVDVLTVGASRITVTPAPPHHESSVPPGEPGSAPRREEGPP